MITWLQENWVTIGEIVGWFMLIAGAIVGFFNGPKAEKARGILDSVLSFLRMIGIGTYKDEPGTVSAPFKKDTGERIVQTESVK